MTDGSSRLPPRGSRLSSSNASISASPGSSLGPGPTGPAPRRNICPSPEPPFFTLVPGSASSSGAILVRPFARRRPPGSGWQGARRRHGAAPGLERWQGDCRAGGEPVLQVRAVRSGARPAAASRMRFAAARSAAARSVAASRARRAAASRAWSRAAWRRGQTWKRAAARSSPRRRAPCPNPPLRCRRQWEASGCHCSCHPHPQPSPQLEVTRRKHESNQPACAIVVWSHRRQPARAARRARPPAPARRRPRRWRPCGTCSRALLSPRPWSRAAGCTTRRHRSGDVLRVLRGKALPSCRCTSASTAYGGESMGTSARLQAATTIAAMVVSSRVRVTVVPRRSAKSSRTIACRPAGVSGVVIPEPDDDEGTSPATPCTPVARASPDVEVELAETQGARPGRDLVANG